MLFLSNPIVHPSARRAKRFEASAVVVQVMPPTHSHRLFASASCVLRPALLLPHYQHRRNGRGNPRDPFHPELRRICSRRMRAIPVRGSCNSLNSFHESNNVHRCWLTKRCIRFIMLVPDRVLDFRFGTVPRKFAITTQPRGQDGLLRTLSKEFGERRRFRIRLSRVYIGSLRDALRNRRYQSVLSV